ncbi:poly(A) polymerase I [Pseudomonas phage UFJF_PfSW6]|uniref:Poly(A) polymerase I n=1 Tax=Pseudomonas phage UFJF_PfSW6 TaxID=3003725 RepID=A0AAF0AF81_9CAUD|nr:poly(A) polymerase I [Pseudomonas phage UFJF_PfSW6]
MVNENDMKRVRRLLALLRAEGIDCLIAGGFARDKFFEADPKDIDIICAGVPHEIIATLFEETGTLTRSYPKYNGPESDRLAGVWKILDTNIDVILYEVPTALEAVSKFDYNLNQFVWNEYMEIAEYVGEGTWRKLVRLRDDARGSRQEKMEQKFHDLVEPVLAGYDEPF